MNIESIIVLALVAPTVAVLAWIEIRSRRHPAPPSAPAELAAAPAPPPAVAPERLQRHHKRSG